MDPTTPSTGRTTFLEFQARNRRAAWRLTAVCALVVGTTGVLAGLGLVANVGLVLFTALFVPAVALLGASLLASLAPAGAWLAAPLGWAGGALLDLGAAPFTLLGGRPRLVWAGVLLLPLGAWLAVRSVWLAAGVGHTLLAIGARPPMPGDLEETQLANIVQEMAVAAGVPPPEVRLLDGAVANAAAIGRSPSECHVVVARRLLDEFDRDETQGVLGHLVGAIGNGDLQGAAQIHSLLYVLDLMIVVVLAPFARLPRRIALQWLLFPVREAGPGRVEEARRLVGLLEQHRMRLGFTEGQAYGRAASEYFGRIGGYLVRLCPPFLALVLLAQVVTMVLLLLVSLPVALLWRSRRYLADATAVQLTRNPTGLARALARLAESGGLIPGGESVAHLFIVGPEAEAARRARRQDEALRQWVAALRDRAATGGSAGRAGPAGIRRVAAEILAGRDHRPRERRVSPTGESEASRRRLFWEREGLLLGLHPPIARRLRRLARMGARPDPAGAPAG